MIGLHTALTELKEKIDGHDKREKATSQTLVNSMRRLGSVSTNMETVANNLGRMDVRLAKLERQIAEARHQWNFLLDYGHEIVVTTENLVSIRISKINPF